MPSNNPQEIEVPFHRASITDAEIDAVVNVLRSGWITSGPLVKQFEQEFAEYIGCTHAVALNSCTAGLHLALEALGIGRGDAVVVPTMTFAATAEVVRYLDANPVFVDCREEDFNMDTAQLPDVIAKGQSTGPVRAIIPVHYGGQIGDVRHLKQAAAAHDLTIVEDAAHCCPAKFRDSDDSDWQNVGSIGDVAAFSFYANKTITTGEGGMATTEDAALEERMRIMSLHGMSRDAWKRFSKEGSYYYEIVAPGYKYNLTDIAAAIGVHQLKRADELHRERCRIAEFYSAKLGDIEELILPRQMQHRLHSWHLYVIRLKLDRLTIDRKAFVEALRDLGITTSVHWMPLHMHPYYRDKYGYRPEDFPVAARLYDEIFTLPLFPGMTEAQLDHVVSSIRKIVADHLLLSV
ncbi:MAG: DegT/DnrJ/EryC1/StrS family aminotransferase [Verrucomicrobia bacterium]|nr:DegT/DnrJ/EryC1/StrS family aminotransferase [Verrucomicrobiota bacterium]